MTRDGLGAVAGSATFSLAVAQVVLPLLGLAAGFSAAELGFFFAASALAQMAVRSTLVLVMRHWTDRALIAIVLLLLALLGVLVVVSVAPVPFVTAQLLQRAAARACFWTGSQTHAVRTQSDSFRADCRTEPGVVSRHDGRTLGRRRAGRARSRVDDVGVCSLGSRLPRRSSRCCSAADVRRAAAAAGSGPGVNLGLLGKCVDGGAARHAQFLRAHRARAGATVALHHRAADQRRQRRRARAASWTGLRCGA